MSMPTPTAFSGTTMSLNKLRRPRYLRSGARELGDQVGPSAGIGMDVLPGPRVSAVNVRLAHEPAGV